MLQRLFYKSKGFRAGLNVTAHFWSARTFGLNESTAVELGDGIYYFEVDLIPERYAWLVFEDGAKVTWSVLDLEDKELVYCADCEYWLNNQCHRRPPTVSSANPDTTGHIAVWPETKSTDGCADGVWKD